MRYAFIKDNVHLFTVEKQCSVLEVSASGYYQWLKVQPSKRAVANAELDKNVIDIFVNNKGRYGALRVFQELREQGQMIGKNRVKKRMQALGLKALAKRKWKATTDSKHNLPIAENLLNRDWNTRGVNQKWVSDVTYAWTREGWLYLATVMDLYSRAIIGWALQEDLKTSLISFALLTIELFLKASVGPRAI